MKQERERAEQRKKLRFEKADRRKLEAKETAAERRGKCQDFQTRGGRLARVGLGVVIERVAWAGGNTGEQPLWPRKKQGSTGAQDFRMGSEWTGGRLGQCWDEAGMVPVRLLGPVSFAFLVGWKGKMGVSGVGHGGSAERRKSQSVHLQNLAGRPSGPNFRTRKLGM